MKPLFLCLLLISVFACSSRIEEVPEPQAVLDQWPQIKQDLKSFTGEGKHCKIESFKSDFVNYLNFNRQETSVDFKVKVVSPDSSVDMKCHPLYINKKITELVYESANAQKVFVVITEKPGEVLFQKISVPLQEVKYYQSPGGYKIISGVKK